MLILTFDDDSLILIDYTAKIKEDDTVFDTTSENIAKERSIYDSDKRYTPALVSINNIAYPQRQKINDMLAQSNVGDNLTVEIPPQDAFGERDPSKVKVLPLRRLGENADRVSVGDRIKVDDQEGLVKLISSGRIRIDFNHKFAGKTPIYDITIVKLLDTPELKIKGIIKELFSIDDESVEFTLDGDNLIVNVPSLLFTDDLVRMKNNIQSDIFSFVPTLRSITFTDIYINEFPQRNISNILPTSEPHTEISDDISTSESESSESTISESSTDTPTEHHTSSTSESVETSSDDISTSKSPETPTFEPSTTAHESEPATESSIVEPDSESSSGSLDEEKY